jgi:hypothetical protein
MTDENTSDSLRAASASFIGAAGAKDAARRAVDESKNDPVPVTGALKITLTDKDGNVIEERNVDNLVTTLGKNGIADQILASPSLGKPTHMAVGTGTTAAALGDTALVTEAARVALTSKTRSANVITYVATFGAGTGTGALTEAGIFDAATTGNLWNRVVFSVINKDATASLTLTWTTTVG